MCPINRPIRNTAFNPTAAGSAVGKCDVEGCPDDATHKVVYTIIDADGREPMKFTEFVCDEHAEEKAFFPYIETITDEEL